MMRVDTGARPEIRDVCYDEIEKPANVGDVQRDEHGDLWCVLGIAWRGPRLLVKIVRVAEVSTP